MIDITEIVLSIVNVKSVLLKHIHLFGVQYNSNEMQTLLSRLKKEDKLELETFHCIYYLTKPKELFTELQSIIQKEESNLQKGLVILLYGIELLCQKNSTSKDLLKKFFVEINQFSNTHLITASEKSWYIIESDYLLSIASKPIHLNLTPNNNDVQSKIATELAISHEVVGFLINLIDLHYKKYELMLHVIRKITEECKKQGIPLTDNIPKNYYLQIGSICTEFLQTDKAFSVEPLSKQNSITDNNLHCPILTKCAIIAVYCASYNPPFSDQIFFFKLQKKENKKRLKRTLFSDKQEKLHDIGPKSFDKQRALFIFTFFWYTFLDEVDETRENNTLKTSVLNMLNVDFNTQIVILLKIGIIQQVSALENFDEPKYRCLCSLNLAENIAKSIDKEINLKDYLYDFRD